jgi:hypothetical protein
VFENGALLGPSSGFFSQAFYQAFLQVSGSSRVTICHLPSSQSIDPESYYSHLIYTARKLVNGFSGIGTSKEGRSLLKGGLNTSASGS